MTTPHATAASPAGDPLADATPVKVACTTTVHRTFVALGDSTVEGLDDPNDRGGYRGWADRLAEQVAANSPRLHYANLAVRGRRAGQVRAEQLPVALAMQPDLAAVFAGLNDLLRPRCDVPAVLADVEAMFEALAAAGATVLTLTLPDLSAFALPARLVRHRLTSYNAGIRHAAARTGALVADLAAAPVSVDPRLWAPDRLHANPLGHSRVAAALAEALGLPGADNSWTAPLPTPPASAAWDRTAAELRWARTHLAPWAVRRLRGRSSGDGVAAKRPHCTPFLAG